MSRLVLFLVLLQMVATGALSAQSLADVARREEARRKQIAKPAKLYTNKDLGTPLPGTSRPPPDAVTSGPAPEAATGATGTPAPEAPAGPTEEEQRQASEEQWRSRMAAARDQLERSKMFAEALQTRANSLWADFTARDDPAQRAMLEAERKKTLAEIDRVKGDIETQTKALADLEEEARRAGVPPGWLR